MKLVSLDPKDGSVLGEVALSQDIPNATVELRLLGDERADLREQPASSSAPPAPSTASAGS